MPLIDTMNTECLQHVSLKGSGLLKYDPYIWGKYVPSEYLEPSNTLLQETKNLHVSVFMEAIPLFITAQTTVIQLNTTQVYLDSNCYF